MLLAVSSSALLAALAYMVPSYGAEAIILSFALLFFALAQAPLTFKMGCVWGIQFYSCILSDFYLIIWYRGFGIGRWYALSFIILYTALISGTWFFLLESSKALSKALYSTLLAIAVTFGYWLFMEHYFFWIIGERAGIPIINPVIPLSMRELWRLILLLLGKNGALLCVILLSALCFLMNKHMKGRYSYPLLSFFLMVSLFFSRNRKTELPDITQKVGCVSAMSSINPAADQAEKIMQLLITLKNNHPLVQTIIMPESMFPYPLNTMGRYAGMWDVEGVCDIIIGSHRKEGKHIYNTLYYIKKGEIYHYYDKQQPLFFTERVPNLFLTNEWARELFFKESGPFTAASSDKVTFDDTIGSNPLICSELFFKKERLPSDTISVCIINDSWFYGSWIARLMYLYGIIEAIQGKSKLLYCSYQYNSYIDPQGYEYLLPSVR